MLAQENRGPYDGVPPAFPRLSVFPVPPVVL